MIELFRKASKVIRNRGGYWQVKVYAGLDPLTGKQRFEYPRGGDQRSVTEVEADEVGASLKWATAKVERTSQCGNGERSNGRERQAERGGDFSEPPPF